ncbi:MAG: hypothetical protein ABSG41_03310 [Bryobacteraceae bacterium]
MSTAVDSANLILKLYELRREETMRQARNFVFTFDPKSAQEYMAGMMGANSAYIRMVTSYWEMAASFVVNGAIDATMFDQANGEHVFVFAKFEPILADLRAMMGPSLFKNLEHVCLNPPVGIERVRAVQERLRGMIAARAAAASN